MDGEGRGEGRGEERGGKRGRRREKKGCGIKQANSAYLQSERGVELGVGWQRSSNAAETGKHSRINISACMVYSKRST